jgi:hypothetical protein
MGQSFLVACVACLVACTGGGSGGSQSRQDAARPIVIGIAQDTDGGGDDRGDGAPIELGDAQDGSLVSDGSVDSSVDTSSALSEDASADGAPESGDATVVSDAPSVDGAGNGPTESGYEFTCDGGPWVYLDGQCVEPVETGLPPFDGSFCALTHFDLVDGGVLDCVTGDCSCGGDAQWPCCPDGW